MCVWSGGGGEVEEEGGEGGREKGRGGEKEGGRRKKRGEGGRRSKKTGEKKREKRKRIYLAEAYVLDTRVVICGKRWFKIISVPPTNNSLLIQEGSGNCGRQT